MKQTKLEKGITLIALIITIIVLLILAGVAIVAIQESDIIGHAENAVEKHEAGKADEDSKLQGYETFLESNIPPENLIVTEQKTLTLTSDTDSIFTSEYQNLFSGAGASEPRNVAKLTYKSGEDKLEVLTGCHDTALETYLVYVKYYKNGEISSRCILRGPSGFFKDDGTSKDSYSLPCVGHAHYVKGWNDLSNIVGKCTCVVGSGTNIYGALTQFPEFVGDWEIDTENSNDYGIQYLQGVLVEKE